MSDDRFADYRKGVETGVMKSATPNAMRDCLDEIERLKARRDSLTGWWVAKDCEDGSLILESHTGERKHVWKPEESSDE